MERQVRRVALAVAWLAAVAVIALGAAGLVGAMGNEPGGSSRAELTWSGDRAIEPALVELEEELAVLAEEVRRLSALGRSTIEELGGGDTTALQPIVDEGSQLALQVDDRANRLRVAREALPGAGPGAELRLSAEVRRRIELADDAIAATEGLAAAWTRLATGSLAAARVTNLLIEHDRVAGEAAALGRSGAYAEALAGLDAADALIAEARRLRDGLANSTDVTILGQWLDRNAEYDAALRHLYDSLVASGGQVTETVRDAFRAERAARELLPADTRGLVIIVADIARGGVNQAVIAIEDARAAIEAAVLHLDAAGGSASPPAPGSPVP